MSIVTQNLQMSSCLQMYVYDRSLLILVHVCKIELTENILKTIIHSFTVITFIIQIINLNIHVKHVYQKYA